MNTSILDVTTSSKVLPRSSSTLDRPDFLVVFIQMLLGGVFVHTSLQSSSRSISASCSSGRSRNLRLGLRVSGQGWPFWHLRAANTCSDEFLFFSWVYGLSWQAAPFHSILGRPALTTRGPDAYGDIPGTSFLRHSRVTVSTTRPPPVPFRISTVHRM